MKPNPDRPPFAVSGVASILHLNIRKQGPDDERVLAVDVKLEVQRVGGLLVRYFDDALAPLFWIDDDAMAVRNPFMRPVGFANEISGASVKIGSEVFAHAEVKKITLAPLDGGMVVFSCSLVLEPNAAQVAALAKLVSDDALVFIQGPPDLFDGKQGEAAAGASGGPTGGFLDAAAGVAP